MWNQSAVKTHTQFSWHCPFKNKLLIPIPFLQHFFIGIAYIFSFNFIFNFNILLMSWILLHFKEKLPTYSMYVCRLKKSSFLQKYNCKKLCKIIAKILHNLPFYRLISNRIKII